ncbi:histidine--tRNA ligase [Pararhizobium sp.]|uniref:histidine--tRNA ligase n=1 Tax=Pararhizobium sp. TaxID=1977563 RepID=UPI002724B25B|nr:histidine--tRNA ligase [Pararhizobium sp.]MDO9415619.1 histidine--tRNA ligase [Pararhizobium sp.]
MNDKKNKPQKLKARLPRGFVDRSAADIRAVNEMTAKIREVYERYGFDPVETPLFEYTDALGKFLPDSDRPNEGVFSLQDDDEQWMSARYDLTAPLARHVAENFNDIQLPYRTYRAGYVFRNEKPGPGRFRQFMQFDADTVGAAGVQADAEMCMMMADTMEALGLKGQFVIKFNHRRWIETVVALGFELGKQDATEVRILGAMRALDKWDRLGWAGVELLLGLGRKDESGDVTLGMGMSEDGIHFIHEIISSFDHSKYSLEVQEAIAKKSVIAIIEKIKTDPSISEERRLKINGLLISFEMSSKDILEINRICIIDDKYSSSIRFDPSVVRGLEYYTGPVFEAELTFAVTNEKGEKVVFGSVGGGGRYDGLVSRFMGQPVPATGFSIGVSRLMTALKNLGKLGQDGTLAPILVTIMDRDQIASYAKLAKMLRDGLNPLDEHSRPLGPTIPVELYQGNPKNFGNQLKYADRRSSPIAIIQGGDERAEGQVQIKDLIEGKRLSGEITDNTAWREARSAQYAVAEADMVAKVREILAAQADDRARAYKEV